MVADARCGAYPTVEVMASVVVQRQGGSTGFCLRMLEGWECEVTLGSLHTYRNRTRSLHPFCQFWRSIMREYIGLGHSGVAKTLCMVSTRRWAAD
jgi:hypothetical protein